MVVFGPKTKKATKRAERKMRNGSTAPSTFGAVSAINTAPVAIGNSVRGSKPRVTQANGGARVVGRDFTSTLSSTVAAITGWEVIGGLPITPCVLPSTILRNYCQMYQSWKVNKLVFHYITSSPTSQAGDVMFYFEFDALAPFPDYTNNSFLPYVLSNPQTLIGPQWTNHSIAVKPSGQWKTTNYGIQTDVTEDKDGALFFFSKTTTANSPGYLLMDYDISFREIAINPRAGILPIARAVLHMTCLTINTTTTAGNTASFTMSGKNVAGSAATQPDGSRKGDVYKVVLQSGNTINAGNTAWSGVSYTPYVDNVLTYGDGLPIEIEDGFTCYARSTDGTNFKLYPSVENAVTLTDAFEYANTGTVIVFQQCATVYLVRNVDDYTQSSY